MVTSTLSSSSFQVSLDHGRIKSKSFQPRSREPGLSLAVRASQGTPSFPVLRPAAGPPGSPRLMTPSFLQSHAPLASHAPWSGKGISEPDSCTHQLLIRIVL